MSFEPPKTESEPRGMPGIVIPLAFLSIIMLGAVLVFGALAFDIGLPGGAGSEPGYAAPEEALESSGFTLRELRTEGSATVAEVEVSIINPGERPVDDFEMLVQCDDDGYVSAITPVSGLGPGEDRTVVMELHGRGEPGCHTPIVEFGDQRGST